MGIFTILEDANFTAVVYVDGMTTTALNNMFAIRNRLGLSRSVLAERMGTSQQQLARLEAGERRLTVEWAQKAAKALGVPLSEVLGIPASPPSTPEAAEPLKFVPVIGDVACGNWREAVETPIGHVPSIGGGANTFALRAKGDSMDKIVPDGGLVGVDPDQAQLHDGKAYIVRNSEGETTAKRYRSNPARLVPASSNPAHTEISIGQEGFTVIGRIVWVMAEV